MIQTIILIIVAILLIIFWYKKINPEATWIYTVYCIGIVIMFWIFALTVS